MSAAPIVFDLDGTLIDSAPDICAIANAVLAREDVPLLSMPEARSFVGHGADIFVRRMRAARDIPDGEHARILGNFLAAYEGAVEHSTIYPGVVDALTVLAAKGHTLGICTNKPFRPTEIVLAHFDLSARFATVIGGDSLPVRKPDPAPLVAAFDALGSVGLYIGDSEVDAETAERAGIPFLLFTEGYRKTPVGELPHSGAFSHWDELPGMVDGLLSQSA